jgi:DNA recombination protein RmuC
MDIALGSVAALMALAAAAFGILLVRARENAARAETRLTEAEAQAGALGVRLDAAMEARVDAERLRAAAEQRVADAERRSGDFERLRQESLTAAKAAVLETAQALSSKLIDDHKRESAEAKQESEERVRQASEHLVKRVEDLTKSVTELSGQVQQKGKLIDTVVRSLSSPGGAGQIAEIGLGNTLKAMGLEAGRDYALQASTTDEVSGQRLRPDALVFLPGNSVLIIDCKSSKYLLEIAEAETGERETQAYANLAQTMNGHLKALAGKDYRGAVQAGWREAGHAGDIARILSIMYLPNEAALEKLGRADPSFFAKAREEQIIPAGPAGLHCAISLAAAEITKERQVENQQRILEAAQALLDGIGVALGHAGAVGKGIRAAAEGFEKFTRSVNQRLLPRGRRLGALGVPLPTGKTALPASLPAYAVMSQESDQLIEGEASEIADEPRLVAE